MWLIAVICDVYSDKSVLTTNKFAYDHIDGKFIDKKRVPSRDKQLNLLAIENILVY